MKYSQFNHIVPVPDSYDHVIMNFGTGVAARLDPFRKKLFDLAMELPEDNPQVAVWKNAGFLTDIDEIQYIRDKLNSYLCACEARTDKVLGLTLHITSGCNFACPYCFQGRRSGPMSREIQDAVVRYARSRLSTGQFQKLYVGWFGGEPLLEPGIIEYLGKRLMETAAEYGAEFSSEIHTNAFLLDQDMVNLLESVNCQYVLITIDGAGKAHDTTRPLRGGGGTYDTIIRNLSGIKTGMRLNIRTNVTASNYVACDELRQVIGDIAQKTGNRMCCSPSRVHDTPAAKKRGYTADIISSVLHTQIVAKTDLPERSNAFGIIPGPCQMVQPYDYTVDDLGYVYPHCNEYAVDASRAYGNILDFDETGFEEIDKKHLEFCRREALPERYPRCMACKLLPVCFGGCLELRLTDSGEPECPIRLFDPDAYVLRRYYE